MLRKLNSMDVYYTSFAYVASATDKKEVLTVLANHKNDSEKLVEISAVWSSSEKILLELAFQLFSGRNLYTVDEIPYFSKVHELFAYLGSENKRVALEAIHNR